MKLERSGANAFRLTGSAQEVSALVGAARLSLETMEHDERAPEELVVLLRRILHDYDAALARLDLRPSDGSSGAGAV